MPRPKKTQTGSKVKETEKKPVERKKREKKAAIQIKDESIYPYYLVQEGRQYTQMKEGNNIPYGYYTTLANALRSVINDLLVEKKKGSTLTLSKYIYEFEQLQTKILNRFDL